MNSFVLLFALLLVLLPWAVAPAQQDAREDYRQVNLDRFIETQRPMKPGTKTILPPRGVRFSATIKRHPEKITVKYLYTALSVMNVEPLPVVNHRMFVATDQGKVIPLYVEDRMVKAIRKHLPVERRVRFLGYHVYNYSKGPAIVISGVED